MFVCSEGVTDDYLTASCRRSSSGILVSRCSLTFGALRKMARVTVVLFLRHWAAMLRSPNTRRRSVESRLVLRRNRRVFIFFAGLICLAAATALAQTQPTYEDLVTQAAKQLRAGDANAAISTCAAARKLAIERYECYVISATALRSQDKIDDAIGMLQLCLAVAPEDKQPAL